MRWMLMALFMGVAACSTTDISESPAELLDPSPSGNPGDGCGITSIRTLAIDATVRAFLPETRTVRLSRQCAFSSGVSHTTFLTALHYGSSTGDCPSGVDCKSTHVCALIDAYTEHGGVVTTSASFLYAEWYAAEDTTPVWWRSCGGFPAGTTNSAATCIPEGMHNPVTATTAFRAVAARTFGAALEQDCLRPYAGRFTN